MQTNNHTPAQAFIFSALVAISISAFSVLALYLAAAFGSGLAGKWLITAILPQFNLISALLPEDLGAVRGGLELVLLGLILQASVVLTPLVVGIRAITARTSAAGPRAHA